MHFVSHSTSCQTFVISRQTAVNIKSPHMYHAEYNHTAYSKNVTPILNNGICGVDIFKIMPLFKICDTYAAMLYSVLSGLSAVKVVRIPATSYLVALFTVIYTILFHHILST